MIEACLLVSSLQGAVSTTTFSLPFPASVECSTAAEQSFRCGIAGGDCKGLRLRFLRLGSFSCPMLTKRRTRGPYQLRNATVMEFHQLFLWPWPVFATQTQECSSALYPTRRHFTGGSVRLSIHVFKHLSSLSAGWRRQIASCP